MTDVLTIGWQRHYRAYLLRLWEVETDGHWLWRASLQDSHTGERLGFAGPEQLHDFLQQLTADNHRTQRAPGEAQSGSPEPGRPADGCE